MEIQYLITLKKEIESGYKFSSPNKTEGISEAKINQAEILLGIQFPKAYKEFLFLAGEGIGFGFGNAIDYAFDWAIEDFQQDAEEELARKNITIPQPFWNFAEADGGEFFLFFFLNDGENPPIYAFETIDSDTIFEEGLPKGVRKISDTFSSRIDELIKHHQNGNM